MFCLHELQTPDYQGKKRPVRLNAILFSSFLSIQLVQFIVLPLAILQSSIWWALIAIPSSLATLPLWYLIHESFHGNLFQSKAANEIAGRTLSVFFGSPWLVVRFGHLMHHAYNRSVMDRPDRCEQGKLISTCRALFYFRLFGGLYLVELVIPLIFFLPREILPDILRRVVKSHDEDSRAILRSAIKQLTEERAVRRIRVDAMGFYALLFLSTFLYGRSAWVLAGIICIRAFIISFADNLPHYGTPVDDNLFAKDLSLPRQIRFLLLNFNIHGLHHRYPSIPWIWLPVVFVQEQRKFNDTWFHAGILQLKGPISVQR